MSTAIYGVLFFVSILLVILIHELGHFTTAKLFKIKVEEFFVGFGPRVWSTRRGETEYGVKALPLGGYVKIAGMNPYQETPAEDAPRSYAAKPAWQRATVIGAGPATHFLIAIFVLAVFFVGFGVPRFQPVVDGVQPKLNGQTSPAAQAGLRAGDAVVAVDGTRVASEEQFISYTRAHGGREIALTVLRAGRLMVIRVTPVRATLQGQTFARLGIDVGGGKILGHDRSNPIVGFGRAVVTTASVGKAIVLRLGDVFGPAGVRRVLQLLGGAPRKPTDVGSIVGVSRAAGQAAQARDWADLLLLFATVNIFVGILNLLPLPPFDGGHLAVVAWEKVTRRKVDQRRLVPVAAVVLGFVILFSMSVLYLDIVNPLPNPFR